MLLWRFRFCAVMVGVPARSLKLKILRSEQAMANVSLCKRLSKVCFDKFDLSLSTAVLWSNENKRCTKEDKQDDFPNSDVLIWSNDDTVLFPQVLFNYPLKA